VPLAGRRLNADLEAGGLNLPAGTDVTPAIWLAHTRAESFPEPFAFRPERFLGRKPGTYEWIPFGGGIRRCLGAALAMAEQLVVLEAMARRLDLEADDPAPEHAVHRNVTMIPGRGARVLIRSRR
jgi:cytochrome P450